MHFNLAFLAALSCQLAFTAAQAPTCNNYGELCSRSYANVTYLTAHNAYAVGSSIAANQHVNISEQLDDGVRALMLDLRHKDPKKPTFTPYLCHSDCEFLNAGVLSAALTTIRTWLEAHKSNVLTLFFENAGKFTASAIAAQFKQAGLDQYCFQFSGQAGRWPTLQEMIAANQNIVVFVDDLVADGDGTPAAPYLLPEYSYVWETPYQIEAKSPQFGCTVDRPKSGVPQVAQPMYVLNHFVYGELPITGASNVSTSYPQAAPSVNTNSLSQHADECGKARGQANFVAVDFYEVGDAPKIVSTLNSVPPPPERKQAANAKSNAHRTHHAGLLGLTCAVAATLLVVR